MLLLLVLQSLCDIAVGIDLGTTFSCARAIDGDTNMLIEVMIDGSDTYPSVVAFDKMYVDGKLQYFPLTGQKAIAHNNKEPNSDNFFYAFKRLMGLTVKDLDHPKLRNIDSKVTYSIQRNSDKTLSIQNKIGNDVRYVRPIDLSKMVLTDIYNEVSKKGKISKVVVTVPAYFTENQVAATLRAAENAGLKIDKTLNEPVAAAYAYQQKNPDKKKESKYVIIDIGGGTLDISLLEHDDGILEVKTYSGNNFLGGENVNDTLFNHFQKQLTKAGYELTSETEKLSLRSFVEEFKITLCNKQNNEGGKAEYKRVWYFGNGQSHTFELTIDEFNKICKPVFDQVKFYINGKNEGIIEKYNGMGGKTEDIDRVLFVGGSSRIPYIREMVSELFPGAIMDYSLNADTCVAEGAAYFAANLAGYTSGALHLVDVVPIPIGICVGEDQFVHILEADKAVPASGSQIFTTQYDNQTMVSIKVAQGMRYAFKDNNLIGAFNLEILKPAPRGVPQIEVTVHMDKDRNISVSAKDLGTNKEQKIEWKSEDYSSSKEAQAEMKAQAEIYAAADAELKARYEAKSELESFIEKTRAATQNANIDVKSELELHFSSAENWLNTEKETADAEMITNELNKLKEVVGSILEPGHAQDVKKEDVREEL